MIPAPLVILVALAYLVHGQPAPKSVVESAQQQAPAPAEAEQKAQPASPEGATSGTDSPKVPE